MGLLKKSDNPEVNLKILTQNTKAVFVDYIEQADPLLMPVHPNWTNPEIDDDISSEIQIHFQRPNFDPSIGRVEWNCLIEQWVPAG